MSIDTRGLTELPLNEAERRELRESQESRALEIENKRRTAKGEEPLTSLREEEATVDTELDAALDVDLDNEAIANDTIEEAALADEDSEEEADVLLLEAGRIVADVLALLPTVQAPQTAKR